MELPKGLLVICLALYKTKSVSSKQFLLLDQNTWDLPPRMMLTEIEWLCQGKE